jgi:hypothetical protein
MRIQINEIRELGDTIILDNRLPTFPSAVKKIRESFQPCVACSVQNTYFFRRRNWMVSDRFDLDLEGFPKTINRWMKFLHLNSHNSVLLKCFVVCLGAHDPVILFDGCPAFAAF